MSKQTLIDYIEKHSFKLIRGLENKSAHTLIKIAYKERKKSREIAELLKEGFCFVNASENVLFTKMSFEGEGVVLQGERQTYRCPSADTFLQALLDDAIVVKTELDHFVEVYTESNNAVYDARRVLSDYLEVFKDLDQSAEEIDKLMILTDDYKTKVLLNEENRRRLQEILDELPPFESKMFICQDCGEIVRIDQLSPYGTVTCYGCDAEYNPAGQKLLPRTEWGWETGETFF